MFPHNTNVSNSCREYFKRRNMSNSLQNLLLRVTNLENMTGYINRPEKILVIFNSGNLKSIFLLQISKIFFCSKSKIFFLTDFSTKFPVSTLAKPTKCTCFVYSLMAKITRIKFGPKII